MRIRLLVTIHLRWCKLDGLGGTSVYSSHHAARSTSKCNRLFLYIQSNRSEKTSHTHRFTWNYGSKNNRNFNNFMGTLTDGWMGAMNYWQGVYVTVAAFSLNNGMWLKCTLSFRFNSFCPNFLIRFYGELRTNFKGAYCQLLWWCVKRNVYY